MQLLCIKMLFNLESLEVAMFGWWQSNPSQELPEMNFLKVKGFPIYCKPGSYLQYLPVYNAHFFPAGKAPKIEMHIIHGILCFRLASLISM